MKQYCVIIFVVINVCGVKLVSSQSGSSFVPLSSVPSPNTANLGLYGEVPVSLFTGIPEISIPLYDLENKGMKMPVMLSYHASGTKIDQHPSWVGMGWSLMAGGSIDRIQRGYPDEKNFNTYPPTTSGVPRGFYTTYSVINRSDWNQSSFIGLSPDLDGSDRLFKDMEPDEFRFSYPGNAGSFFLNEQRNWCVRSERPVKVLFDEADIASNPTGGSNFNFSMEKTFKKFTLVDGMGYKYVFGGTEESIEYTDRWFSYSQNRNYFSSNSWKLTKILAPNGQDLFELGYERGPTVPQLYYTAFQKSFQSASGGFSCGGATTSWFNSIQYQERGNVVSPVYLKYIKCTQKDIKLNFITDASQEMSYIDPGAGDPTLLSNNPYLKATYGIYKDENNGNNPVSEELTGGDLLAPEFINTKVPYFQTHTANAKYWKNMIWFKLLRIEITNSAGSLLNSTVRFDYNNGTDERLRLSNVVFLDKSSTAGKSYQLRYNSQAVGRYLTSVGDHWGFYNNGPSAPSIYLNGNLPNIATYRAPSLQYTQAGVLTEIVYPTGGSTRFEYELNACSKVVNYIDKTVLDNYTAPIGGLRVKKIINDNGAGNLMTKEYFYVKNYTAGANVSTLTSSGILQAIPSYSFQFSSSGSTSLQYSAYYTMPLMPLTDFSSGNYIGYSEVVEKLGDNSYTIFKYTNHDNGYADENFILTKDGWFNYQIPVSARSHERGKLLEKMVYDNLGVPVSKVANSYTRYNDFYSRAVRNGKDFFCSIPPTGFMALTVTFDYFHKTAYKIYYNSLNLTSSTSTTYSKGYPSQSVSIVRNLSYNNNNDVISDQSTDSKGDLIGKAYSYPADFPGVEPYATMVARNIISPVIQENTTKNSALLLSKKTNFDFWNGATWSTIATNDIVPKTVESKSLNQTSYETRLRYNSYDDQGDLTSLSKEGDVQKSYIWGYNKTRPIAEVTNAKANEIFFGDFEQNGWSGLTYTNGRSHTGRYSGLITNSGTNEIVVHSDTWMNISLSQPTKFKYSGWIYSTGPSAEIFLFMKTATETGYYTYVDSRLTNEKNKWVYVEGEYTVPANITKLNIRLDNNGSGKVWFDDVRLHPSNAQMITYTYDPFFGMTSQTDINNRPLTYQYDGFGRLIVVRDQDNNIVKKFCYNYTGQAENCNVPVYSNDQKQGTFTKLNCPVDAVGGSVVYTVPAGTYTSTVSQEDANQKAEDDVDANGQAHANAAAGPCTWYNDQMGAWFTKSCSAGGTGNSLYYVIGAAAFSSTNSKADANQLAQNALNSQGQNYANNFGTCTWYSAPITANYFSQNCGPGNTANPYYVTVPAAAYSSTLSQSDADAQAQAYAQSQANQWGTCQQSIAITSTCYAASNCFQVEFYNPSTGFDIWFDLPNGSMITLGSIPPGTYEVGFYSSGCDNGTYRTYGTSCSGSTGNSNGGAYFQSVTISLACRGVYIN